MLSFIGAGLDSTVEQSSYSPKRKTHSSNQ